MEIAFRLSLPRESASVPIVRRLCRCSFSSLGIEDDCAHDLELVVTEACTNVLKHASGKDEYEVEVATSGETCDIQVKDAGKGFDHAAHGQQQAQAEAEAGRGIHLMRLLVDRLHFVSEDSGTMVHLQKSLTLREDSPLKLGRQRSPATAPYTG